MNRSELRHTLVDGAEDLGIELPLYIKATALLSLELMSDDQINAVGGVIDEGIKALKNGDYEEVRRIIKLVGGTDEQADEVVEYARTVDRDPAQ